jgi:ABC-type branched-subunit amino acid transport system substrate-binding protein
MPAIGLNTAVLSIVAQNHGAGLADRVRGAWLTNIKYGAGLMFCGGAFLWVLRGPAMQLFTTDPVVIAHGMHYLGFASATLAAYPILFVTVFMMQGLKRPAYGFWIGVYRQIVAPILVFYTLAFGFSLGLSGVWWHSRRNLERRVVCALVGMANGPARARRGGIIGVPRAPLFLRRNRGCFLQGHSSSTSPLPHPDLFACADCQAAPLMNLTLSFDNAPREVNPQGLKTTFRVVADDVHLGGTLGKYAVKDLKGKSIAIIDDRTAYGQGVADEFEKAVKAAGGKIAGREFTTDKSTDFMAILTTIKGKKPDIVFFGGMDAVGGPMLKQMKSLGINVKFMGGDGICTSELAALAGDAMADGQVVCAEAGGVEGAQKKDLDAFNARYKSKFNVDVKLYAPYVYDAVNVMVDAMVKAKSSDPKVYLPVLAKTTGYKGVTGTISFDSKGDIKNGALTLYTYKAGKRDAIAVVR